MAEKIVMNRIEQKRRKCWDFLPLRNRMFKPTIYDKTDTWNDVHLHDRNPSTVINDIDSVSTHYQTTHFRLFQTKKKICRRQFQIRRKWRKVIQMGRKHCGKRRNCSLRAISPFTTVFSKGLSTRGVKRCRCVGMG